MAKRSHFGLSGREIADEILYPAFEEGAWYTAAQALEIVQNSGKLSRGEGNCSECNGPCLGDLRYIDDKGENAENFYGN